MCIGNEFNGEPCVTSPLIRDVDNSIDFFSKICSEDCVSEVNDDRRTTLECSPPKNTRASYDLYPNSAITSPI